MRTLNVSWLIAGDEAYGAAQQHRSLMQSLDRAAFRLSVIALDEGPFYRELASWRPDSVRHLGIERPRSSGAVMGKLRWYQGVRSLARRNARRLAAELRQAPSDICVVAWPDLLPLAAAGAAASGARLVWQIPGNVGRYPFDLNRRVFAASLRLGNGIAVASSEYQRALLAPRISATVIPLGVDSDVFKPTARESWAGIPDGAPVALQVGRIHKQKGQLTAVSALATQPSLHLLLAGEPADEGMAKDLERLCRSDAVAGRVHVLGYQPAPQDLYRFCDFGLSLQSAEPFGLSVVEAMLCGRPVLATNQGGPGESILDEVTGWLIEGTGELSAQVGLARAMADRSRWTTMGAAARSHASEHFSIDAQTRRWTEVLATLIST